MISLEKESIAAMRGRIDEALRAGLADTNVSVRPEGLRKAMADAVFPGGGRLRPRLVLAVAESLVNHPLSVNQPPPVEPPGIVCTRPFP